MRDINLPKAILTPPAADINSKSSCIFLSNVL